MSIKNSSDTIRNRTHDLLACSSVPQPTAPPCTPIVTSKTVVRMGVITTIVRGGDLNEVLWDGRRSNGLEDEAEY